MFTGAGAVLANLSLFILQKVPALDEDRRQRRALLDVRLLHDRHRVHSGDRADRDGAHQGADSVRLTSSRRCGRPRRVSATFVSEIKDAVRTMPVAMHKIGVVFLFQWYAMFIYWQFLAVSLGETVFNATPEEGGPAWEHGDRLERSDRTPPTTSSRMVSGAVPGGFRAAGWVPSACMQLPSAWPLWR